MIKLNSSPSFFSEAHIIIPGMETPEAVKVEFRALGHKRLIALMTLTGIARRNIFIRALEFSKLCLRARKIATVVDMLDELIVSWEGVDVPYSKAGLLALLQEYPGSHQSLYLAYLEGYRESRLKN